MAQTSLNLLLELSHRAAGYPEAGFRTERALSFVSLALSGQAGKLSEWISVLIRDRASMPPEHYKYLTDGARSELGAILHFWLRACVELGVSPDQIVSEFYAALTVPAPDPGSGS